MPPQGEADHSLTGAFRCTLLLTDGGRRKPAFVLEGGPMPPFMTEAAFWVFVLAVTLILIFVFGIDVSSN
jgi:hypothetical protein